MRKSSVICESCGQDNETGATFCIECGASISASKSGKLPPVEEPIPARNISSSSVKSRQQTNRPNRSRSKRSRSGRMGPMHMLNMNFNPMFLMMPIMIIIVIIFLFFN